MWGTLLVLALLTTVNPIRLAIILLVLCRPRPISSLLAYWSGCVIVGLATVLVPLLVLHSIPTSESFVKQFADPTDNPTAQRIALGIGGALIAGAVLIALHSATRRRAKLPASSKVGAHQVSEPATSAEPATRERDSNIPPAISRLVNSSPDSEPGSGSVIARLLGRIRNAWQNGSPWPAFVIGVIVVPPLDGLFLVLALIVASGSTLEVQLIAAVVYIIGMLTVEEIILVSNLVAPAKTEAALRRLHGWTVTHQRAIMVAFLAVVGIFLVARSIGSL
ncbi:GAP family protein [Mycolicibacterium sp. GF69]|uniref:GAP family protein n=1 Tax=Mycolicibacterium sp. GF69 TaxID=2267251 RepID=UPI000DCB1EFA|nr:GAP family protein [Mycolicibacterium sp. GF69]RAV13508.1 GAP family protein [Mycolicibacterium sp. GF69]